MNKLSFKLQLGSVFFAIVALIFLANMIINSKLNDVTMTKELIENREVPTYIEALKLSSGIYHSLAQLRGMMLLRDEAIKIKRAEVWANEINPALEALERNSLNWDDKVDLGRLARIKIELIKFRLFQSNIENLVNTIDELPATKILVEEASPLGLALYNDITKIIELETDLGAGQSRKDLLKAMADFRGSMSQMLATVRIVLLTGDPIFFAQYNKYKLINEQSHKYLTEHRVLFSNDQTSRFETLTAKRTAFLLLPPKMFKIRSSKDFNRANALLRTTAAPTATIILEELNELQEHQKLLLEQAFTLHSQKISESENISKISFIIILLLIVSLATFIIRAITTSLSRAVTIAERIGAGERINNVKLSGSTEISALGTSLSKMNFEIASRADELESRNWVAEEVLKVSELSQGNYDLESLAPNVISVLSQALGAGHGALYIAEYNEKNQVSSLSLTGSYAFKTRKNVSGKIAIGEGLIGQCAKEKSPIHLTDIPSDYIHISSALGNKEPKNIFVVPVLFEKKLFGVMELASFSSFSEIQMSLLEQAAEKLGTIISSIRSVKKTEELLIKSEIQSENLLAQQEELKQQSEELQASNEELEEQAQALRLSEEELKQQSEELQVTNEEMEQQAQVLRQSEEELKQQSEELQASNEELEENSKNLEAQKQAIENQKNILEEVGKDLEIQTEELRQANKYKSEFLSNMSHELRTPLNSMLILSQSLAQNKKGNLTKDQAESASVINHGGNELLRLINDILDLSKVEAGKIDLHIEDVTIKEQTDILLKQFKPLADDKELKLSVKVDKKLNNTFPTDSQRLQQILKNLLSNSIKFTSEGSVILKVGFAESVSLRRLSATNNQVIFFSVIDTGFGISESKRSAIFSAFQQEDGSTSRLYGGTGLGLTISRELATLLGGELHLSDSSDKGSTFTLYLPLDGPENNQADNQDAHELKETIIAPLTRNSIAELPAKQSSSDNEHKIEKKRKLHKFIADDRGEISTEKRSMLIIEDDKEFAKILQSVARNWGYCTIVTDMGLDGLDLTEKYNPTAILLDLGLPDIDGAKVLAELKENSATRHIPVHIVSAGDKDNYILNMGAIGYMTKPVTQEGLEHVFSEIEQRLVERIQNILVVEDDKDSQFAITSLIESKAINIEIVGSGKEAIKALKNNQFDCIILDLNLPDISGFELLNKLPNLIEGNQPPIIVYTGAELSHADKRKLEQLAASVVIKGAESPDRLVDDVTLFLHSVEDQLPLAQREAIKMVHDRNKAFEGRKILLVDDDMRNIFALSQLLSDAGLKVEVANNGQLALNKLSEIEDIDLVLMDVMMPVMDGLEATREIRKQQKHKNLPIIALTAKAMPQDREDCIKAGANDYATKPVETEKLLSLLRMWLFKGSV